MKNWIVKTEVTLKRGGMFDDFINILLFNGYGVTVYKLDNNDDIRIAILEDITPPDTAMLE